MSATPGTLPWTGWPKGCFKYGSKHYYNGNPNGKTPGSVPGHVEVACPDSVISGVACPQPPCMDYGQTDAGWRANDAELGSNENGTPKIPLWFD